MTEQEKWAKVIAELERVADEANPWKESPPLRCDISYPLLIDAITLLKAQELRVMTATEAYTADYVYIEFDGVITPAIRTTNERDGHRESYFATQQLGGDWMRWGDYGITWRCWTSRPTDEQREATPWQNT